MKKRFLALVLALALAVPAPAALAAEPEEDGSVPAAGEPLEAASEEPREAPEEGPGTPAETAPEEAPEASEDAEAPEEPGEAPEEPEEEAVPAPSPDAAGEAAGRAVLDRLGTPKDLTWGVGYSSVWSDGVETVSAVKIAGIFSWTETEPRSDRARVRLYRKDAAGDVLLKELEGVHTEHPNVLNGVPYHDSSCFLLDDRESGEYYFTVQAMGDGETYADSEAAVSPVWSYVKPGIALPTPSRPVFYGWEGNFTSDYSSGAPLYHQYRVLFAPDGTTMPEEIYRSSAAGGSGSGGSVGVLVKQYGDGFYYVQTRAVSREIDKTASSGWSELSEPYVPLSVGEKLETIVNSVTPESTEDEKYEAISSVWSMDQEELVRLMSEDRDNTGAAGLIAELERKAGNESQIEVNSDFLAGSSAIGAGLNDYMRRSTVLAISPEGSIPIPLPSVYSKELPFYVDLYVYDGENYEEITSGGGLLTPLKIDMPLPVSEYFLSPSPDHLRLLQYREEGSMANWGWVDGTWEEVPLSRVYQKEDGRWFFSFVTPSVGLFVMAERRLSVKTVPGGVEAELSYLPEDADSVYCGLYDGAGRLLDLKRVTAAGALRFAGEGKTVKVFSLDAASLPAGIAWECGVGTE